MLHFCSEWQDPENDRQRAQHNAGHRLVEVIVHFLRKGGELWQLQVAEQRRCPSHFVILNCPRVLATCYGILESSGQATKTRPRGIVGLLLEGPELSVAQTGCQALPLSQAGQD